MLKIGFIGAGTVGTALAILLDHHNYRVVAVSSRSGTSAKNLAQAVSKCQVFNHNQGTADASDLVFITTPDDAIPAVAKEISWSPGQSVVHCSGADSTDVLDPANHSGAIAGCFHPLQTLASINEAVDNIPGSTFAIEAEPPLLGTLKDMATAVGGYWIELKADDKAAYHAAAVIACNYLTTLVKLATDLWQTFSIHPTQSTPALLPLLLGTLKNLENIGLPQCLTGPIARGDTSTIKKHMDTLQKVAPSLLMVYKELGLQTIPIAVAKGKVSEHQARELESALKQK